MYSDENKSSSLAKFLNGFDYAMIDTCSLMDEAFPNGWMPSTTRRNIGKKDRKSSFQDVATTN